jgi:hypothetical protein
MTTIPAPPRTPIDVPRYSPYCGSLKGPETTNQPRTVPVMTQQDRTELAQYRAIFGAITAALTTGAAAHLYYYNGKFGVRLSELDGQTDCTTVAVTGTTLRDAMAQAAQVVA